MDMSEKIRPKKTQMMSLRRRVKKRATVVPFVPSPPKIRSFDVIPRVFPSKLQQIHIISVSGHCMCLVLKICQTVAGISKTSPFHEFFGSNFWLVFDIWPHGGILKIGGVKLSQLAVGN